MLFFVNEKQNYFSKGKMSKICSIKGKPLPTETLLQSERDSENKQSSTKKQKPEKAHGKKSNSHSEVKQVKPKRKKQQL